MERLSRDAHEKRVIEMSRKSFSCTRRGETTDSRLGKRGKEGRRVYAALSAGRERPSESPLENNRPSLEKGKRKKGGLSPFPRVKKGKKKKVTVPTFGSREEEKEKSGRCPAPQLRWG